MKGSGEQHNSSLDRPLSGVGERTLVLGLGNPILCDDAVGPKVALMMAERLEELPHVDVTEASVGGLRILDLVVGYKRLILIDAIRTGKAPPGTLIRLKPGDLTSSIHLASPHDVNLPTALELGRVHGLAIPETIHIYAVEVDDVSTFSEACTPAVERAVPEIAEEILRREFGFGPQIDADQN
jgi:hydrogenase maturation protease